MVNRARLATAPYLAFFLSGASSLIFQSLWTRMLHQTFGATSVAMSTVLTAFMSGLGLGAFAAVGINAALAVAHAVSADELGGALGRVARARGVALRPLSQVLVGFAELGQTNWSAWVRKQNVVETRPRELAAVVAEVSAFVDPLLVALQPLAGKRWDPAHRWRRLMMARISGSLLASLTRHRRVRSSVVRLGNSPRSAGAGSAAPPTM